MHRAIETRYQGRRFRSRLEARYAVLFDALGVTWDYEPEGFELGEGIRYLPDFFLSITQPNARQRPGAGYWVEVKPTEPTEDEMRRLALLSHHTGHIGWLFAGSPDRAVCYITSPAGDVRRATVALSGAAPLNVCAATAYTPEKFNHAVTRALSARFEFGENGTRA